MGLVVYCPASESIPILSFLGCVCAERCSLSSRSSTSLSKRTGSTVPSRSPLYVTFNWDRNLSTKHSSLKRSSSCHFLSLYRKSTNATNNNTIFVCSYLFKPKFVIFMLCFSEFFVIVPFRSNVQADWRTLHCLILGTMLSALWCRAPTILIRWFTVKVVHMVQKGWLETKVQPDQRLDRNSMFPGQRKSCFPAKGIVTYAFSRFPSIMYTFHSHFGETNAHFTIYDAWQGSLTQTLWHPPRLPSTCDNLWSTGRPRQLRRCLRPIIQWGLASCAGRMWMAGLWIIQNSCIGTGNTGHSEELEVCMIFSVIPTISLICTIKKQKYKNFDLLSLLSLPPAVPPWITTSGIWRKKCLWIYFPEAFPVGKYTPSISPAILVILAINH